MTETSPALDWAVNLPFAYVRSYAEKKGWKVIPVIEREQESRVFNIGENTYEIMHDGIRICRVMKNGKEILWNELPNVLKGLL